MTEKKKAKTKSKLPDHEIERIRQVTPTVDELRIIDLRRDYRAVRNGYFGKSIPPVEDVLLAFLSAKEMKRIGAGREAAGSCLAGFIKDRTAPYAIVIQDDLSCHEIRITLLHEMAHLKVNIEFGQSMGHGNNWKREMRRLAASGAFDEWW